MSSQMDQARGLLKNRIMDIKDTTRIPEADNIDLKKQSTMHRGLLISGAVLCLFTGTFIAMIFLS